MKAEFHPEAVADFLAANGYSPRYKDVGSDWSTRDFYRVTGKDQLSAILMICTDKVQRSAMSAYIDVASRLSQAGLRAPEIYATDLDAGFMLVEDFGGRDFISLLETDKKNAYELASDVLVHLQARPEIAQGLPDFFQSHICQGHIRVLDWYVPTVTGQAIHEEWRNRYLNIWTEIEQGLPESQKGFVHMDYHPGNMMFVDGSEGVEQCGIIDFQDACIGPVAYDYTNLLKDIRRDVPQDIQQNVLKEAVKGMTEDERNSFHAWYDVLSLQFHFRIAGQVIKLLLNAKRDDLIEFLPRTLAYVRDEIENPRFKELKEFFAEIGVDFTTEKISPDRQFILQSAV